MDGHAHGLERFTAGVLRAARTRLASPGQTGSGGPAAQQRQANHLRREACGYPILSRNPHRKITSVGTLECVIQPSRTLRTYIWLLLFLALRAFGNRALAF